MDANKLKALIDEVAIVKDIGVDIGPNGKTLTGHGKARPKKIKQIIMNEFGEEEEIEIEEIMYNPTLGYAIVGLKERHAVCELGCGEVVTNQKIQKKLIFTPERHWRTYCTNCKKTVGPDGELIYGQMATQNAFSKHFFNKQDK
jgi:hypothetical protein